MKQQVEHKRIVILTTEPNECDILDQQSKKSDALNEMNKDKPLSQYSDLNSLNSEEINHNKVILNPIHKTKKLALKKNSKKR